MDTISEHPVGNVLRKIYYDARHPAGFASKEKLFTAARSKIKSLTRDDVDTWLKKQITYTLHKPARRQFKRNRIIVTQPDEEWEADLVEMQEFANENNGYRYILTVIDCFSKFAWVAPLKSKSAEAITTAFTKILNDRKPCSLRTDKGKEFMNRSFQKLLEDHSIRFYSASNPDIKCAIVERFNRTLKNRMFRFFTSSGSHKFMYKLKDLVAAYNSSIHRSIKMAPMDVRPENAHVVFRNLYGVEDLRELYIKNRANKESKLGPEVRLKYSLKPFDKSFYPTWTDQVYKITNTDASKNFHAFSSLMIMISLKAENFTSMNCKPLLLIAIGSRKLFDEGHIKGRFSI